MKIGIISDCLKKDLTESLKAVSDLGIDAVQIYATKANFNPEITAEQKEYYKNLLKKYNLKISALCGDLEGHGFEIENDNAIKIEKTKKILDLAVEFNTQVVTTHIGVIPANKNEQRYAVMLKALTECGKYAKSKGVTLAVETGPEKADVLKSFIEETKGGIGVNLDPANFVMVTGQDPVEAVYLLKDYIVHTHVKDGIMLKKTDPKIIYNYFAEGGIEALNISDFFIETPLGKGNVNFKNYIKALKDIGYDGCLTIERETGNNPLKDIRDAIAFIKAIK